MERFILWVTMLLFTQKQLIGSCAWLSLVLIYRRPSAIIADEDLAMLAIYENISFLPSPTIVDRLRSSAMSQISLFLAIIADGEKLMRTLSAIIADEV